MLVSLLNACIVGDRWLSSDRACVKHMKSRMISPPSSLRKSPGIIFRPNSCCVKMLKYANTYPFVEVTIKTPCTPTNIMTLDGKREGDSPGSDLLLQAVDLLNFTRSDLGLEVLELVVLLGELALDLLAQLDAGVDVAGDLLEILLAETS